MSGSSSSSQVATGPTPVAAAIVRPRFCASRRTDLTFFERPSWLDPAVMAATDVHGNVVFKVESRRWGLGHRHVVLDESEKPVLSVKKKKLSGLHDRWEVLSMGDGSSDDNIAKADELLFVVKRLTSALSQQKAMDLDVFLAANTKRAVADFRIKGSYENRNSGVYKVHDSPMAVAQMSKEFKYAKRSPPEVAFGVIVSPETDLAFVTALVVIMHEVHMHTRHVKGVVGGVKSTASSVAGMAGVVSVGLSTASAVAGMAGVVSVGLAAGQFVPDPVGEQNGDSSTEDPAGDDVEGCDAGQDAEEEDEDRSTEEPAGDDVEGSEAGQDVEEEDEDRPTEEPAGDDVEGSDAGQDV